MAHDLKFGLDPGPHPKYPPFPSSATAYRTITKQLKNYGTERRFFFFFFFFFFTLKLQALILQSAEESLHPLLHQQLHFRLP
ncbi:hypothetical protein LINPERPRIM_LOCUS40124 [Linum perenne]